MTDLLRYADTLCYRPYAVKDVHPLSLSTNIPQPRLSTSRQDRNGFTCVSWCDIRLLRRISMCARQLYMDDETRKVLEHPSTRLFRCCSDHFRGFCHHVSADLGA
jgi:hypothetical protein